MGTYTMITSLKSYLENEFYEEKLSFRFQEYLNHLQRNQCGETNIKQEI